MAKGKHIFRGVVEVPYAEKSEQAVNLGQVKDLLNRYNKEPVDVATTTELSVASVDTATGTLTLTKNLTSIDGVTLSATTLTTEGSDILVKDQLDKTLNGVYVVDDLGTVTTPSSASTSVGGSGITGATVNVNVFETKIIATGSYVFTYDGVTDMAWKYSGSIVSLVDYGITETGTANDGDTITVNYTAYSGTGAVLKRRDDFTLGTTILNNTFVNVMEGTTNGDTRWTIVSDGALTCGTSNFTFIKDVDTASGSVNVIKASITGDGATTIFSLSHNINLKDAYAYVIYVKDNTGSNVFVDNAPTVGNENNSITLGFEVAPKATETFKVFILGLE